MRGLKHNGVIVLIEKIPGRKKPVLTIQFEGEICHYKVASFNNEEAARWFEEVMEEFFEGFVAEGE